MRKRIIAITVAVLLGALFTVGVVLAADADPGTTSSDIFVMALEDSPASTTVLANYYPASGGTSPDVSISRVIDGYGGYEFTAAGSGLTDGWSGSVIVSANNPVAALGELTVDGGSASDGKRLAYYSAVDSTSDILFFPFLAYAKVGGTGDIVQFSRLSVQNTDSSATDVYITYIDRDGTSYGPYVDTIPAQGVGTYDMTSPGDGVPNFTTTSYWTANGNWTGGAIITSTKDALTGALLQTWRQNSGSYTALTSGDEKIYLTNIERRLFSATSADEGGWNGMASIVVQNFDLESSVDITVTFYSKATGLSTYFTDTLAAGGARGYNTRAGADTPGGSAFYTGNLTFWDDTPAGSNPTLGSWSDGATIWVGSAVVEGEPGADIAAVVFNKRHRDDMSAMYTSAADGDASTTLAYPMVYRYYGTHPLYWNLIRTMNVGTGDATVDILFYDQNGTLDKSWLGQTASQYQIVDGANLKGSAFNDLGNSWVGTVVISSTQPMVGTSDVLWFWTTSSSGFGAYNAYPFTP